MFILILSVHNFADDNSLSNIATNIDSLRHMLESEYKVAIKWLHENKMIVNPDKFHLLDKSKSNNTDLKLVIVSGEIEAVSSVEILDITIDDQREFNLPLVVITTVQLHSTKPELRFCAGSNPARGVSLEIRLIAFRRSIIPQNQFIIIIIIIIIII